MPIRTPFSYLTFVNLPSSSHYCAHLIIEVHDLIILVENEKPDGYLLENANPIPARLVPLEVQLIDLISDLIGIQSQFERETRYQYATHIRGARQSYSKYLAKRLMLPGL